MYRTNRNHVWPAGLLLLAAASVGCQRSEPLGPVANAASVGGIREALLAGAGGSGESASESSVGTGWSTLRGRFVFEGTPPEMTPYGVKGGDTAVCSPGGQAPPQETLVVDPDSKGIAHIAVYLRKAPRVHESAKPAAESVVFDQKSCVFLTHVFALGVGQTMEIRNSDPVGHNTNIEGKNAFNQTIPAGGKVDWVIKKEEALPKPVRCSIHPWMISYLLPRENGYVAVTDAQGNFEIANLPAGEELELQVWHESAPGSSGGLVLSSPQAKELSWDKKGRFKIVLTADQPEELELSVPASAFGG